MFNPAPGRWKFALRAGICMSVPVLVGWLCGDTGAGLIAVIGGFTSLYGSGRPYRNRAGYLAGVAVFLAAGVALGDWAAAIPWLGLVTITVIAMLAALVCHALTVGPPGAYMFVLGCAAGTATASAHLSPWHIGALVLAGGAFSWLVHLVGALWGLRRPEHMAVQAARAAVDRYLQTRTCADRHQAARALHQAWTTLVVFQPAQVRPDGAVARLRMENLRLHRAFAAAVHAVDASTDGPDLTDVTEPARDVRLPLGRPGTIALLRRALTPGSESWRLAGLVGIAVALAGLAALLLVSDHTYWAMAAAVLMLHQGLNWARTVARGIERLAGTLIGLGLAAAILSWQPQGWWLVALIALLQFTIEMFVVRNYAVAVVFITPLALTIASGGRPVPDLGQYLLARGLDTLIGCAVALLVYWLALRRRHPRSLEATITATDDAIEATEAHLRAQEVTSAPALAARRDLQVNALAMLDAYQAAIGGSPNQRAQAERLWPTVAATEQRAFATLAACWQQG
ncbi:FUSC family protein [Mycolicibacterium diernhoferi]